MRFVDGAVFLCLSVSFRGVLPSRQLYFEFATVSDIEDATREAEREPATMELLKELQRHREVGQHFVTSLTLRLTENMKNPKISLEILE